MRKNMFQLTSTYTIGYIVRVTGRAYFGTGSASVGPKRAGEGAVPVKLSGASCRYLPKRSLLLYGPHIRVIYECIQLYSKYGAYPHRFTYGMR